MLGKNGVAVDGEIVLPGGTPVALHSQAYLEIGQDVKFYFLLPVDIEARANREGRRIR